MKKNVLLSLGSSLVALSVTPSTVYAADEPQAAPDGIAEIIVTARRVDENQQRVPVAVTSLSADKLTESNIKAVTDIQFSVPNLQIKPSNLYPGQPEFIIRGQRQQLYTDENVVTYVNGVPQSTRGLTLYDLASVQVLKGPQGTLFGKSSLGGAMVFTTARPTYDFGGSVELEYGNYDRKAATAVLNIPIVTDKAALRIAGNIERRDGVFDNPLAGQIDVGNRRNESIRGTLLLQPSDRFESITTGDYLHRNESAAPAVIEAAPTAAPGFAGLVSLLTQQAVTQQSALAGATPVLRDGLLYRQGSPFHFATQTGVGKTASPVFADALGNAINVSPYSTLASTVKAYGFANTSTYELSDAFSVRNILGYRYEESIDQQDPGGIGGFAINVSPVLGALGVPGLPPVFPATVINNTTHYRNSRKALSEELQFIVNLPNFKFIAGGFYSHMKDEQSVNSFFTIGFLSLYPVGSHYREGNVKTNSTALFGQGTYDFSEMGVEGLKLTLGARYNWDSRSLVGEDFYSPSNAFQQNFNAAVDLCAEENRVGKVSTGVNRGTQCGLTGKQSWKALTWTASLEYQVNPQTLVYLANRRGYKSGGVTPTSSVNPDFNFFAPEKITDFELGFKHQGSIGSVPYRLNIAGFIGKYKNIQTQDIISFCVDASCPQGVASPNYTDLLIFNVGQATIKGVEVEGTIKPIPELTLDFGFSHQVGRYGKGSIIPQPQRAGPVGAGNPIDFTSGVDLNGVEFPGVPRTTFSLAGNLAMPFIPESFAKVSLSMNYAYRTSTRGLRSAGVFGTPGYGVLGGRLSFNDLFGSPLSLAVWAQNLTNNEFRLSCADNLNSIGYAACKWGDPRTFGTTVSAKF